MEGERRRVVGAVDGRKRRGRRRGRREEEDEGVGRVGGNWSGKE
jgi:hypothetical protein